MDDQDRQSDAYDRRAAAILRKNLPGLLNLTGIRAHMPIPWTRRSGFRYSWLPRLINDSDLACLPRELRPCMRSFHRGCYIESIAMVRMDARGVLAARRQRMISTGKWDYATLVKDDLRIERMLVTLRIAALLHTFGFHSGYKIAKKACEELDQFFTACVPARPVSAEAIG